jgi:hypothetical protein
MAAAFVQRNSDNHNRRPKYPWNPNLHTSTQPLETKETHSLIGSDKVEGNTSVYRSNGERIGKIPRVMIGKQSGKVGYAVMSFGGFMGIGEDYYPLPWSLLIPDFIMSDRSAPIRGSQLSRCGLAH